MPQRLVFPATARNRDPILAELRRLLPPEPRVVEIASGSGEHAVYFNAALGGVWQPTDPDPAHRASIDAWRALPAPEGAQVLPALDVDVLRDAHALPGAPFHAVFCANMIHIAPWEATPGLGRFAARQLDAGGLLVLYGPFVIVGEHTAPSNEAFDQSLKARNPDWGVRDLGAVIAAMPAFEFVERVAMPANNQTVVLRRRADPPGPA